MLKKGKLNLIIDGQFGSTGKGLVASFVGTTNKIDIAITNASTNAGHTFYIKDKKYITKHLPVTGILNNNSVIYICAGAIINPKILLKEIEYFDVSDRIIINPKAAIIEQCDIDEELNGSVRKIASTMSGVGSALCRKIKREGNIAINCKSINKYVRNFDLYSKLNNKTTVMEVPQGLDLSLNSGLSYPHCTSREITISGALSDVGLHPSFLGKVIACIRTYPIRVGHIIKNDKLIGDSGPFYKDSKEISWKTIGVPPEFTTNTNRIRRVATFSFIQYKNMLKILQPDYIFLNFANYITKKELKVLLNKLPEITHVCYGPKINDIIKL